MIQQMTVDINSGLENLGDEEEEQGLAEVAEDGNDCQRHPAEVTKCVACKSVQLRSLNWYENSAKFNFLAWENR